MCGLRVRAVLNYHGPVKRLGKPPLPPTPISARGHPVREAPDSPQGPIHVSGASVRGFAPPLSGYAQSTDSHAPRNVSEGHEQSTPRPLCHYDTHSS